MKNTNSIDSMIAFVMKHITTLFFISLFLLVGVSCSNYSSYQKKTEEVLIKTLSFPSSYQFISFEFIEEATLSDQIQDRISFFSSYIEQGKKQQEESKKLLEQSKNNFLIRALAENIEEAYMESQKNLEKSQKVLEFLEKQAKGKKTDLNSVVSRTFCLTYDVQTFMRGVVRYTYYSMFNEKDKLVAVKNVERGQWIPLGNMLSIPGYYEKVEELSSN